MHKISTWNEAMPLFYIKNKGVQIEYVTLHVGLGTFLDPLKQSQFLDHTMHKEYFENRRGR